jgi:hypothetical protein
MGMEAGPMSTGIGHKGGDWYFLTASATTKLVLPLENSRYHACVLQVAAEDQAMLPAANDNSIITCISHWQDLLSRKKRSHLYDLLQFLASGVLGLNWACGEHSLNFLVW